MITVDLRHLFNPPLCKAADSWAWAMQSRLIPGGGHAAVEIPVTAVAGGTSERTPAGRRPARADDSPGQAGGAAGAGAALRR